MIKSSFGAYRPLQGVYISESCTEDSPENNYFSSVKSSTFFQIRLEMLGPAGQRRGGPRFFRGKEVLYTTW